MKRQVDEMEHEFIEHRGHLFLTFPELSEKGLLNCMTTSDMDVGTSTNGNVESIRMNLDKTYEALGDRPELLYNGYQNHTDNLEDITGYDQGLEGPYGRFIPSTDGLITGLKNIGLLTRFADCVPIVLFDPFLGIQSNIHSGWKGTLLGIGNKGAQAMKNLYSSEPGNIIALIGPSIGRDDFEVEYDVAKLFELKYKRIQEAVLRKNKTKYLVDLQLINHTLLIEAGIPDENIHIIPISTFSDRRFHSYRRDQASYGLMGMITMLK